MWKQLRCLALCVLTLTGINAWAVEQLDQPKTPEDYYAMGEQMGRCAAFLSIPIEGYLMGGKHAAASDLSERQRDWSLATEVFLSLGRAADAKAAGQTVMDAELNRLHAHINASPNKTAISDEVIAEYHKRCDPLESWRYGAVMAVKESIRNGEVVRPAPER